MTSNLLLDISETNFSWKHTDCICLQVIFQGNIGKRKEIETKLIHPKKSQMKVVNKLGCFFMILIQFSKKYPANSISI